MGANSQPHIIGIGGTTRSGSSTEMALRYALSAAASKGATTALFAGPDLMLPMYNPDDPARTPEAKKLVEALRRSDGIIIGSPGYHGGISGLVKNALDYVEDMRDDAMPYFDRRAVGCISCAFGPQAIGTTLIAIRSVVHALRGWPTPLGVGINTATCKFQRDGVPSEPEIGKQLEILASQVIEFAQRIARSHDVDPLRADSLRMGSAALA